MPKPDPRPLCPAIPPTSVIFDSEQHPDKAELIAAYHLRWHETPGDALATSVDLLAELKANGLPLYALTNGSQETFLRATLQSLGLPLAVTPA